MPSGKETDKNGIHSMNFLSIHSKSYNKSRKNIAWQNKWHKIFKDYSDAHRVECTCKEEEIADQDQKEIRFPTQSKYEGSWSALGIGGYGIYILPNGVLYEGAFKDGMFHGKGIMRYPAGVNMKGLFVEGLIIELNISFSDGLEYSTESWSYCRPPDRRFCIEYDHFLQPHDLSYLTNEQPTRYIPKGYYDTGDGFFDSATRIVKDYMDLTKIVRAPSVQEQEWILRNCRTNPDLPVGALPDMYEQFPKPILYLDEFHDNNTFEYAAIPNEPARLPGSVSLREDV